MAKAVGAGDQRRRRTEPDLDEHVQALVAALLVVIALAALAEVLAGRAVSSVAERPHDSTWEAPARIGEAALARGDAPAARRAYLTALFRARGERSVIGVLRAAQGFKALGDRDVVDQTLAMAVALGGYESGGPRNAPPGAFGASRHSRDARLTSDFMGAPRWPSYFMGAPRRPPNPDVRSVPAKP